ncbi:MAG: SGNH/GDSL hydrolase family protein [Bacteroidaceae bacterium]|nr:SGNH/GDSL hydrolase family protein [Bacteroidaceae bacterium]
MKRFTASIFLFIACVCLPAQTVAPFQRGDRVTFVGNSITDGGHYHSYIWLYYMTHFPRMRLWMANCGVGGDTAKEILARFDDDVLSKRPTVLTFTFGMNDTGYYEYNGADSADFARRKLEEAKAQFALCEEKLKALNGVRTIMIGTSPYDQTSTFNDDIFARKNDNMQRVIAVQKEAAQRNGWEFLDFNAPMVALNMRQQQTDPAFTIIGNDRIHPDNDGHMAMAYLFLQAQGMVGQKVADMELDAASGKVMKAGNCRISKIKRTDDGLQFDCLAASLPFPLDTIAHGWGFSHGAAQVTRSIPSFIDDLSDEHLTVKGLGGRYELTIDGIVIDTLSAASLSAGINLSRYRHTPQYQQALVVMALNETRWEVERRLREWAWVNYDFMMPAGHLNDNTEQGARKFRELCKDNAWLASKKGTYDQMVHPEVREAYRQEMDCLVDRIYELNQPRKHTFLLKKL